MYEMSSPRTPNPANANMLDRSLCDKAYLEAIRASFLKKIEAVIAKVVVMEMGVLHAIILMLI